MLVVVNINTNKDMDNKQNNQPQMQLEIKPEIASGVYSNFAVISHSSSEFTLDFASMLPGMPKACVGSRVIMSPEYVVRLVNALQENIMRYENQFGKIHMPGTPNRTIAPFSNGGGEA